MLIKYDNVIVFQVINLSGSGLTAQKIFLFNSP